MDDSGIASLKAAAAVVTETNREGNPGTKCGYCHAAYALVNEDPSLAPTPKPLMKCAGCLTTYYCSKEHQRSDWKRHKTLCKVTQLKLAAVAAAEAEAQLSHGAPVVPMPASRSAAPLSARRCGSNTQLYLDQREQQLYTAALINASESSCRSSNTNSPPSDHAADGGSANSSIHGSMADLIAYHTPSKFARCSVQTIGNPKRARFPLTVIRERRSSIGAGEAARLAVAAAAAAAVTGNPAPCVDGDSESEPEEMETSYTSDVMIGGGRKRPAASSIRNHSVAGRIHAPADRCVSDAEVGAARLQEAALAAGKKKDHRRNAVLDLFTDQRFQLDAMVPRHTAFVLRVRRLAVCVASALREYGWCVVDHFLGETHAKAIYHETTSLYMTPGLFADGQLMKAAPPGQAPQLQSSKDVRSDQIYWFDNRVDRGVHISFLVSMVDSILFHLTEHIPPYRVNGRSRAMIACYPGLGTKYVRHVDNPDRDGRCVTTIYYLNEHWKPEHGGALQMYPESSTAPVTIEPLFDRLLFFWSDRRNPHEVVPSYRNRFAITIWYFDAAERAEALAREQREQRQQQLQQQAERAMAQAYLGPLQHTQQGVGATRVGPGLGIPNVERGAPARFTVCNELTDGVADEAPPSITSLPMDVRDLSATQDDATNLDYSSLAQSQHSGGPHQGVTSMSLTPSGFAQPQYRPLDAAMAAQLHQALQQSSSGGLHRASTSEPSFVDYSMPSPADIVNKLLSFSARGESREQTAERRNSMREAECDDINLTSPARSKVDPVSDNW